MQLAERDQSAGGCAVDVHCIRCHARKRLADVRPDLDGPAYHAYFCDPGCVPVTAVDAAQVYFTQGWQMVGDQGWVHYG